MKLTKENYHSLEANREYFSVSQFKSFRSCEAKTMATLKGNWSHGSTKALLVGSYVHAWNEGEKAFQEFMEHNQANIFKSKGKGKYSDFETADKMIEVLKNDRLVEKVREGNKEVIMTAEMFGVPWKICMDIYNPNKQVIADLKTTRSITQRYWDDGAKEKVTFVEYHDYLLQMAIYLEVERINRKAENYFHPHIIAVSKEDPPDKAVIYLGQDYIEDKLLEVEVMIDRYNQIKAGEVEPKRCETCDYCRATKQLTKVIHYLEIA